MSKQESSKGNVKHVEGIGKVRLSPKLASLIRWEKIQYVYELLDSGETPNAVANWVRKNGFQLSNPLFYEFCKIRQNALLNGISMEKIFGVNPSTNIKHGDKFNSKKDKLKNELDALNKIIEMGYNSLDKWQDKPIPITTLMSAIKLKNELTDGYFGGLTDYGLQQLTLMEKQKYDLLIDVLMKYIPEELREQATQEVATTEERFYKESEYYEDFLRASGLTEKEIAIKLKELEEEQEEAMLNNDEGVLEV